MNAAKRALSSSKNFVVRHKTPIIIATTVVATTIVVAKAMGNQVASVEKFLDEQGLLEQYYATFADPTDI